MWFYKLLLLIGFLIISISGCNFQPLYSKNNYYGICQLSGINIDSSNDKISIMIRRKLEEYINSCPKTDTKTQLISKLLITSQTHEMGALYIKTGEATRKILKVSTELKLYDEKMSLVDSIHLDNSDSYNSLDSPFSEYVANQNAQKNASIGLVNKIIIKLNRYTMK